MKVFKVPVNITLNNNGIIKKFAVEITSFGETREEVYENIQKNLRITTDIYPQSMYEVKIN